MIVEDSQEDLELYKRLLRRNSICNYEILTAEFGDEGLELFLTEKIDCILLDYGLPDMSGLDFLDELSNKIEGGSSAVVMITGQGNEEIAVEAMKRGAQDYIVKSALTSEQMAHSIYNAIEKVSLRSALTQANKEIETLAFFDSLTGLANRNLFRDRFEQAIKMGRRSKEKFALMIIDLDGFKDINDTHGHMAGDKLLQAAAQKLGFCVRDSDTVSRFGGDEFMIILRNVIDKCGPDLVARKILDQFSMPVIFPGKEVFISGSIGISIFPDDAEDFDGLMKNADTAMYHAKEEGSNVFRFFTHKMGETVIRRKNLEKDLQLALNQEELQVHYQPIIDMKSRRLIGAEALLRWPHPERGMIPPDEFIPIAEDSMLILPIGEWVLRTVCEQAKLWVNNGLTRLRVAVNLSGWQCRQADFPKLVRGILEEAGLKPEHLALEITESVVMGDEKRSVAMLQELHEIGLHIAIDDFGTGYSSLGYLKRFPIDTIKIDRSFILDVLSDSADKILVEAITAMTHRLGLNVVAEGIETEEQLRFLDTLNCDYGQGYYFGRPLHHIEFEKCARDFDQLGAIPEASLNFDPNSSPPSNSIQPIEGVSFPCSTP